MAPQHLLPPKSAQHEREQLVKAIQDVAHVFKGILAEESRREGLNGPMFWTLHYLITEEPENVKELAEVCAVTSAHVSVTLDELVRHGLVERSRSEQDRRVVRVSATPRGRTLHRGVWEHFSKRFGELLQDVDPRGLEATTQVLRALARAGAERPEREVGA
jgi:MarR family transcriptional regulator, organic hydroperoxide resistance regulator